MTKRTYNNQIVELYERFLKLKKPFPNTHNGWRRHDSDVAAGKIEFNRLWDYDTKVFLMSVESLKMMIKINVSWRAISLHYIGIYFDIKGKD